MPKGFSPIFPPRRPSGVIRYALALLLIFALFYISSHNSGEQFRPIPQAPHTASESQPEPDHNDRPQLLEPNPNPKPVITLEEPFDKLPESNDKAGKGSSSSTAPTTPSNPDDGHPIGKLIYDAQLTFAELLSKESKSVEEAAQAYRKRRGRHPPPGFDTWFKFAQNKSAVIVEDFFDQIYDDIQPFWGMEPKLLRKEAVNWEMTINVRNGKATTGSDWFWTEIWLELLKTIEHLLPDMDLALNPMDEPRLVAPHEEMVKFMKAAAKTVKLPKAKNMRSDFQKLPPPPPPKPKLDAKGRPIKPPKKVVEKGTERASDKSTGKTTDKGVGKKTETSRKGTEKKTGTTTEKGTEQEIKSGVGKGTDSTANTKTETDVTMQKRADEDTQEEVKTKDVQETLTEEGTLDDEEVVKTDEILLDKKKDGKIWYSGKGNSSWDIVRQGCSPKSLARTTELQMSWANRPEISMKMAEPHLYKGYVSNFTLSSDLCHQPDLQGLEGILIAPISTSATHSVFPMFGGSKLSVNNEILIPAPMYWQGDDRFTGGKDHGPPWASKKDKAVWRGVATGGRNKATNWRGFQRHRFVAMNNATTLASVERGAQPENFALPEEQYHNQAQAEGKLSKWVKGWSDIGFTDLMCDPPQPGGSCNYTGKYFGVQDNVPMADQFGNKYMPDVDGNSFSGRYLGLLKSTSLPIKSTLWREWHDSRLVPWKHFVPMDNRFGDWFGIMEYFIGFNGENKHDLAGEKIATEGKEWADKVLRKEDMQIYVLRVLLEYARVTDDDRGSLGWVDDVLADPSLEKTWSWWW